MAIYRLYSGSDGESHIEELDLASHPELTSAQATTNIIFRETPPGRFSDWHTAPRRQYIITVSGHSEIAPRWYGSTPAGFWRYRYVSSKERGRARRFARAGVS